jgi:hypothetical protein
MTDIGYFAHGQREPYATERMANRFRKHVAHVRRDLRRSERSRDQLNRTSAST